MRRENISFRNRKLSARQLPDAVLIALASKGAGVREGLRVREIGRIAGLSRHAAGLSKAISSLARRQLIRSTSFEKVDFDDRHFALTTAGYARAVEQTPKLLGARIPLRGHDPVFDDSAGQVEIDFLGERIVVGCIEGDEGATIRRAELLEINAGEVLKAVAGLDERRAMLMAGLLAMEQVEELNAQLKLVPPSDRIVALNHNSPEYVEVMNALKRVTQAIHESNYYRQTDPQDQERRLTEIDAGERLLFGKTVSVAAIKTTLLAALRHLAVKFVDVPIGEAAKFAWNAVKALLSGII